LALPALLAFSAAAAPPAAEGSAAPSTTLPSDTAARPGPAAEAVPPVAGDSTAVPATGPSGAGLEALAGPAEPDALAADLRALDLDDLDARTRSTLLFGGSSPVSFSGEARVKFQDHYMRDFPLFMKEDRARMGVGYEGNESILRLGMVVRPNRSTVLWSKIGFQHTMPGNFLNGNQPPGQDGFEPIQDRHDKMEITGNIHEDMSAGLAIRTVPASAWLRMGNVLWTEASPLTIWKAQPRTFAWEYLP
jgi:hypothetical protein